MSKCKTCKNCARYFRDERNLCYLAESEQVNCETEACEDFIQAYDCDDEDEYYTPSATYGDYSPSNPWDAPGMSIHDFI